MTHDAKPSELLDNWARHYSINPAAMDALRSLLASTRTPSPTDGELPDLIALADEVKRHLEWRQSNVARTPSINELRRWEEAFRAIATGRQCRTPARDAEVVAYVNLKMWRTGKYWPDDCFSESPGDDTVRLILHPEDATPEGQ